METFYKILCAILATLLLTSCGSVTQANQPTGITDDVELFESGAAVEPDAGTFNEPQIVNGEAEKDERLGETYEIPLHEIYIDAPGAPYHRVEHGLTDLYGVSDHYGVGITRFTDPEARNSEDAFRLCNEEYRLNLAGKIYVLEFDLDGSEEVTINGIDCVHYWGTYTFSYGDSTGISFTEGYAFLLDGVCVSIEGTVFDYDQPQEEIDEIKSIVDAMIHTVRTEA